MSLHEQPSLVCAGNGAVGVVAVGPGFAVRYDHRLAWLCWLVPDGIMVARTSSGPARPAALAERPGLALALADDTAVAEVAALTTPGWWLLHPPEPKRILVVYPRPDLPVLVPQGRPALVAAHDEPELDREIIDRYTVAIRAGLRPQTLALHASPGPEHELAIVLDGHHALAAYRLLGIDPVVRLMESDGRCWHPNGGLLRHLPPDTDLADEPYDCEGWDWKDCLATDPLEFGQGDLVDAFRGQPRSARLARPVFAAIGVVTDANRPGWLVESEGVGAIRVLGSQQSGSSMLVLNHRPAFAAADINRGTLLRLVATLAPTRRPARLGELTEWLADPQLQYDYSGNPVLSRETLDRLSPLLQLFEPGCYEIALREDRWSLQPGSPFFTADRKWPWSDGTASFAYGFEKSVVPTDRWPPPDTDRIAWYRERIAAGAQPVAVLVSPGPAGPNSGLDRGGYLIDGHHKVAAGASLFIEITPCRGNTLADSWLTELDEASFPQFEKFTVPDLDAVLRTRDDRGDGPVEEAEYYARYGVRYGNPAADRPHRDAADRVLYELAGTLGTVDLADLREVVGDPVRFESMLLDRLTGARLSRTEFAMVADLVADLDNHRLNALTPRSGP
ncbi:hypothetical protein AB4305_33215 [Nocardia sp. 2YAB30]|uniref:hypothetical protein n=1 Tax=Nocardia sp. 2YAB30 TaxID=3233022 RepID=UPI003F967D5C